MKSKDLVEFELISHAKLLMELRNQVALKDKAYAQKINKIIYQIIQLAYEEAS